MIASRNKYRMCAKPRGRQQNRRGSVYILVLCMGMILCVIGVALTTAARTSSRALGEAGDWAEAQTLAIAASEHAMCNVNSDANWRTDFNGVTVQKTLGRGTFSWRLTDETDNNLTDSTADPFVILATGTVGRASYTLRVHMTPGSAGGGLTAGVVSTASVTLTGSAFIDSYDSTLGAYGGSNVSSKATIVTNSTANGAVSLAWSTAIKGSVQVGAGGNPSKVVSQASGSNVTGTTTAMSQNIQIPTLTAPTNLGSNTGDLSYINNTVGTVSGNLHVNNFTVDNSGRMKVSGAVTMLVEGNINLAGSGVIEILPGGSLTIYVKGSTSVSASAYTLIDGPNLSSFTLLNLGTKAVNISGSGNIFQGVIESPNGPVNITGSGQMSGAIITNQLSIQGGAKFHEDRRISTGVDHVAMPGSGGSSAPKPDAWTRVVN